MLPPMSYRHALLLAALLVAPGCGPDDGDSDPGNARFQVRESVQQLHVTHADPGVELAAYDQSGKQVQTGMTDKLGSLIFRRLPPGAGYE